MTIKDYNLFNTGKFYYQWGPDVIGIYPTPTETKQIRIHYVGNVEDLVSGEDESDVILDEYSDVLISYAVMQISKRINPSLYGLHKSEWESLLEEASMGSKIIKEEFVQSSHKDF